MDAKTIAAFNFITAERANQIYCGSDDWIWLNSDGDIAHAAAYLAALPAIAVTE
jgi:hypothetical protein